MRAHAVAIVAVSWTETASAVAAPRAAVLAVTQRRRKTTSVSTARPATSPGDAAPEPSHPPVCGGGGCFPTSWIATTPANASSPVVVSGNALPLPLPPSTTAA